MLEFFGFTVEKYENVEYFHKWAGSIARIRKKNSHKAYPGRLQTDLYLCIFDVNNRLTLKRETLHQNLILNFCFLSP